MKHVLPAVLAILAVPPAVMAQTEETPSTREVVKEAAKAPLEDVNLVRDKIPAILLAAEARTYARPAPSSCAAIARQIADLDAVLGEDFDSATAKDETSRFALTEDNARRTGAELAKDAATSVVPFRGWVRRLSGAEKHAEAVRRAVAAGRVRRGYLKGVGESAGCKPPAAPQAPTSPR